MGVIHKHIHNHLFINHPAVTGVLPNFAQEEAPQAPPSPPQVSVSPEVSGRDMGGVLVKFLVDPSDNLWGRSGEANGKKGEKSRLKHEKW